MPLVLKDNTQYVAEADIKFRPLTFYLVVCTKKGDGLNLSLITVKTSHTYVHCSTV